MFFKAVYVWPGLYIVAMTASNDISRGYLQPQACNYDLWKVGVSLLNDGTFNLCCRFRAFLGGKLYKLDTLGIQVSLSKVVY